VDLIKIDTQGFELQVLDGARSLIEASLPRIMVRAHEEKCRATGHSVADVLSFLLDRGYEVYQIAARGEDVRVREARAVDDGTFYAIRP
jgi:hypothetical protein